MKAIRKHFLTASIQFGVFLLLFVIPSGAQYLGDGFYTKDILVTDLTGHKQKLSVPPHTYFEYSDSHKNSVENCFEIILPGSPRKSLWIHYSQIKVAGFQSEKKGTKISLTFDDGQVLSGMFPDDRLKISGQGELGNMTYDIRKIKSIEFPQFLVGNGKAIVLDRAAAASRLKARKVFRTWTIVDGGTTINAEDLQLRDSYYTNSWGYLVYSGRFFRVGPLLDSIMIEVGASQTTVQLDDLEFIEITGRKVDDKPEVIIVKKDGKKFTGPLLMMIRSAEYGEAEYGNLEEDDMLIWRVPYGYEGVSLLPLRKITLKAGR